MLQRRPPQATPVDYTDDDDSDQRVPNSLQAEASVKDLVQVI